MRLFINAYSAYRYCIPEEKPLAAAYHDRLCVRHD